MSAAGNEPAPLADFLSELRLSLKRDASAPRDLNPRIWRSAVCNVRECELVPLAGLEPARCCHHLILSQARLPIPPQGQGIDFIIIIRIWIACKRADGHQNGRERISPQPAAL